MLTQRIYPDNSLALVELFNVNDIDIEANTIASNEIYESLSSFNDSHSSHASYVEPCEEKTITDAWVENNNTIIAENIKPYNGVLILQPNQLELHGSNNYIFLNVETDVRARYNIYNIQLLYVVLFMLFIILLTICICIIYLTNSYRFHK